eukprot:319249-Karenia_brevis.AAC.1
MEQSSLRAAPIFPTEELWATDEEMLEYHRNNVPFEVQLSDGKPVGETHAPSTPPRNLFGQ